MKKGILTAIVAAAWLALFSIGCKNGRHLPPQYESIGHVAETFYHDANFTKKLHFFKNSVDNVKDRNEKKAYAAYIVGYLESQASENFNAGARDYTPLSTIGMALEIAAENSDTKDITERLIAKGITMAAEYAAHADIPYYKAAAEFYEQCLPFASNPATIEDLYGRLVQIYKQIGENSGNEKESAAFLKRAEETRKRAQEAILNALPTLK